jgi:hypothetical protein
MIGNLSLIILLMHPFGSFGFHFFIVFDAYDSEVCSFDGITEFLHIPFAVLESFV